MLLLKIKLIIGEVGMYSCFASTNKGLEELLVKELGRFGVNNSVIAKSGVQFNATFEQIMYINLWSRIASRVMIEVGSGFYRDENDIYDLTYEIDWANWFSVDKTIKVHTSAIACPLRSLEFVSLKVKDAMCDKFVQSVNERPNVNKFAPDIRVYNFLTADQFTVYLDTSGESLFKRGYRQSKLEAPLKENLAAGIIMLSNWTPDQTFFDPMCGSGTFVIEATSIGLNIAPGLKRHFAFQKFKTYEKNKWENIKTQALDEMTLDKTLDIYASDIDSKAINVLEDNCNNLGILKNIKYKRANFLDYDAPNLCGTMVTNPPYGIRLDELDTIATMYPQYASHLKNSYENWSCHFFTADLRMPKLMRLKPERKIPLHNGALDCRLYEFKMVKGSNRK
jgi:putative N6-adenine-specific DNA methylase